MTGSGKGKERKKHEHDMKEKDATRRQEHSQANQTLNDLLE
jgi:hypothetical protein